MAMNPYVAPFADPFMRSNNWMIPSTTGFDMSMTPFSDTTTTASLNEVTRPMIPLMSADLRESETEFTVHVDLPGVEDLDISIQDRALVIKAERKIVKEDDRDRFHSRERQYGKVQRRIMLPPNADIDKAQATFKDGVLNVAFPKMEGAATGFKKLEIK